MLILNSLQLLSALELGLIYCIVGFGVFLSFKIIDFPDLTVDGSFTLGAAVTTSMIVGGYDPLIATSAACLCGALAGLTTGILSSKFKIFGLLAGILTMTALYSVNLRIMQKPNISIISENTIFQSLNLLTLSIIVFVLLGLLHLFFKTELGLASRASGSNIKACEALGIKVKSLHTLILAMSNLLVALSGSLFSQSQGFADISMGSGTIIIGLAAVIIGEAILSSEKILFSLAACLAGAILYRILISVALNSQDFGLEATDLNLITSVMVVITMVLSKKGGKII